MSFNTSGISQLKTIYSFPVLWEGWECDPEGLIKCDTKGNKYLILTDHGSPYVADKQELIGRINEYKDVIAKSEKALQLLEE